jgi:CspA family cold shock protein
VTARLELEGRVETFDEAVGLGEVSASSASGLAGPDVPVGRYRFHCTQIADGSRTIAVGTWVSFRLRPGRDGRWEAADIRLRPAGA